MKFKVLLSISFYLVTFLLVFHPAIALDCDPNKPIPTDISQLNDYVLLCQQNQQAEQKKIDQYQSAINAIKFKIKIAQAQIAQTTVQINQLEKDIQTLTTVVTDLDKNLSELIKVYLARVRGAYMRRDPDPITLFFSSDSFAKFFTRIRYIAIVKTRDQLVLSEITSAKKSYNIQKQEKTAKQKQVEDLNAKLIVQKAGLSSQQSDLQNLITISQGNAGRYAELLKQSKAELEALASSQLTGKKDVNKGDPIGLMGSTGNSTGPHLHFGVYDLKENDVDHGSSDISWYWNSVDPTSILEKRNLIFLSKSCDDVSQNISKEVGSGNSQWPLNNPYITQCWGHTPYGFGYNSPTRGHFHDGLDMAEGDDIVVRAVDDGVAYFYRGATSFGNNVRIFHKNGKMTLYLHLQ